VLEDAEYPKAFPHLLMSATRADCDDLAQGDASAHGHSVPTGWCLSPAVCYHAYAQLSGRVLADPVVISARGRCFRAERESAPGVRQVEFEMREIVLVGSPDWLAAAVDTATPAIERAARGMDLSGEWEAAEDPFFLPAASGKALMQRLLKVKVEYQWPRAGGLALASINRHGTFFGERFDITTPDKQPIHTACVAVGLDRWAHAGNLSAKCRVQSEK
jgi:seryl-tRNA synthetase